MFIHCRRVKLFWNQIECLLLKEYNVNVKITMKTLLCGLENQDKKINLVLIIAMFTIYKSWMLHKDSNKLDKIDIFQFFMTETRIRMENESALQE